VEVSARWPDGVSRRICGWWDKDCSQRRTGVGLLLGKVRELTACKARRKAIFRGEDAAPLA
jgi:hypothetical protein